MPAFRPAQTGAQAGHLSEATGRLAGPGRCPGRGGDGGDRGNGERAHSKEKGSGRARGGRSGAPARQAPQDTEAWTERVGEGRRWRQTSSSTAAGGEEETDGGDDARLPSPIPCTGTTRTTRRRGWRPQLALGKLLSTAMRQRARGYLIGSRVRVSVTGEKREEMVRGERKLGQRGPLIHRGSAAVTSWCVRDACDELGRYSDRATGGRRWRFCRKPPPGISFFSVFP